MILQFVKDRVVSRAAKAAGMLLAFSMVAAGAGAQVPTRTLLSLAPTGSGATLTARVADVSGNPAEGGIVSFETAQGSVGSAVVENGTATLTVDKLPQSARTITAAYSGNAVLEASAASSTATPQQSQLPDFSLTANPTSVNVTAGQYANITITVTPENGFNDMVSLSCSQVPSGATCTFSPTTLTPLTTAPVTSTLQIQTQGASGKAAFLPRRGSRAALAIAMPGILALAGLGALRRRPGVAGLRVFGFAALLAAGGVALGGCSERYGYLNHPPSGNPGLAAGTYTILVSGNATVSGTSVTVHSVNLTLTVK
ncbi:MAG: Ig-like domain repeat protein [Silvibacterium sp.]|nr:Ig-like domain repeat protein [Silvibacterium sp.]